MLHRAFRIHIWRQRNLARTLLARHRLLTRAGPGEPLLRGLVPLEQLPARMVLPLNSSDLPLPTDWPLAAPEPDDQAELPVEARLEPPPPVEPPAPPAPAPDPLVDLVRRMMGQNVSSAAIPARDENGEPPATVDQPTPVPRQTGEGRRQTEQVRPPAPATPAKEQASTRIEEYTPRRSAPAPVRRESASPPPPASPPGLETPEATRQPQAAIEPPRAPSLEALEPQAIQSPPAPVAAAAEWAARLFRTANQPAAPGEESILPAGQAADRETLPPAEAASIPTPDSTPKAATPPQASDLAQEALSVTADSALPEEPLATARTPLADLPRVDPINPVNPVLPASANLVLPASANLVDPTNPVDPGSLPSANPVPPAPTPIAVEWANRLFRTASQQGSANAQIASPEGITTEGTAPESERTAEPFSPPVEPPTSLPEVEATTEPVGPGAPDQVVVHETSSVNDNPANQVNPVNPVARPPAATEAASLPGDQPALVNPANPVALPPAATEAAPLPAASSVDQPALVNPVNPVASATRIETALPLEQPVLANPANPVARPPAATEDDLSPAAQSLDRPTLVDPVNPAASPSIDPDSPAGWAARLFRPQAPAALPSPTQPGPLPPARRAALAPRSPEPPQSQPTPLSESSRRFLQPLVGIDPNQVRIYRGAEAAQAAAIQQADGLASADSITIGAGYGEDTPETLGLLAHELTHVARRREARFVPPIVRRERLAEDNEEQIAFAAEQAVTGLAVAQHTPLPATRSFTSGPAPANTRSDLPPGPAVNGWGGLPAPWEPMPEWISPGSVGAELSAPPPPTPGTPFAPTPVAPPSFGIPAMGTGGAPFASSGMGTPAATGGPGQAASVQRAEIGREAAAPAPTATLTTVDDTPSSEAPGPDIDALARQVYALLKRRLATERRRSGME
jgi:hypothetical protein